MGQVPKEKTDVKFEELEPISAEEAVTQMTNEIEEIESVPKPTYSVRDGLNLVQVLDLKIEVAERDKKIAIYDNEKPEVVKSLDSIVVSFRDQRREIIRGIDLEDMGL